MKKIHVSLIAMLLSMIVYAQEPEKMDDRHESHKMEQDIDHEARAMIYADKMATRLSLDLEQKEKIKEAKMKCLEDEQDLMTEMMEGNNTEMEAKKTEIEKEFAEEMKDILTDKQFSKWKPMHEREMKMHGKKAYKKNKEKEGKETDY